MIDYTIISLSCLKRGCETFWEMTTVNVYTVHYASTLLFGSKSKLCKYCYGLGYFFIPSPSDTVGEDILLLGCPCLSVRLFAHSSWQILLLWYLVNGWSNLSETFKEYSPAPTYDLIRFWKLEVKCQGQSRLSRWCHVDVGVSMSVFYCKIACVC